MDWCGNHSLSTGAYVSSVFSNVFISSFHKVLFMVLICSYSSFVEPQARKKCSDVFWKCLFLNSLRECLRIEKSNFLAVSRSLLSSLLLRYTEANRIESVRWREKSLRVKSFSNKNWMLKRIMENQIFPLQNISLYSSLQVSKLRGCERKKSVVYVARGYVRAKFIKTQKCLFLLLHDA